MASVPDWPLDIDKIERLFRSQPSADDEQAARADAEALRQQTQEQAADFFIRDKAQGGPL